jgi:hypothetical protein
MVNRAIAAEANLETAELAKVQTLVAKMFETAQQSKVAEKCWNVVWNMAAYYGSRQARRAAKQGAR